MSFVVAMLAALFMLKPVFDALVVDAPWGGFGFLNYTVQYMSGYYLFAAFLGIAAYFYAMDLVSRRPSPLAQRLGNAMYALAILVPPLYLAMAVISWIDHMIESATGSSQWGHNVAIFFTIMFGAACLALFMTVRRQLTDQDKDSAVDRLGSEQVQSMSKATGLLEAGLYDMVLIEAFRSVETALKRRIVAAGGYVGRNGMTALLEQAEKHAILTNAARQQLLDLRTLRNRVVHENLPLNRDQAEGAVDAARQIITALEKSLPAGKGGNGG